MKTHLMALVGLAYCGTLWAGPVDQSIDQMLKDYFKIQTALAQDSTERTADAAQSIHQRAMSIRAVDADLQHILIQIVVASRDFSDSDLKSAREGFFELSKPLLTYLNQYHEHRDQYFRYFCPMAQKAWIQPDRQIRNPYEGQSMESCGQLID